MDGAFAAVLRGESGYPAIRPSGPNRLQREGPAVLELGQADPRGDAKPPGHGHDRTDRPTGKNDDPPDNLTPHNDFGFSSYNHR